MAYAGLFTNTAQGAAYAAFRPRYPAALYKALLDYLGVGSSSIKLPLMVDVATGSGQAFEGLVDRFDKIIGVDSAQEQINEAPKLPHVEYRQGDAHSLPVEDGSVDLITCAQAMHWFDRPRFYKDCARALRPGTGVLAVWTYDSGIITPAGGPVDKVFDHMLNGTLGPYWAAPRVLVDENYKSMEPMDPYFTHTERQEFPLVRDVTVDEVVGYVSSWSSYVTYKKKHPDLPDPLIKFRQDMETAAKEQGDTQLQSVKRLTLLLAKGPKKE